MLESVIVGIVLFATTNIDDVFLTMAFFADPGLRPRAIVAGKYAGIAALVAASSAAAVCALAVSAEWIALMGIAPLGLGIHRLVTAWRARARPAANNDDASVARGGSFLAQVASVAAITAANGGDNLGVYIPVFAQDIGRIPAYTAIFAVMTALWCVVGRALVTHRLVAATMRRLSGSLLPWVLIVLGLWILKDALPLLRPADDPGASQAAAEPAEVR